MTPPQVPTEVGERGGLSPPRLADRARGTRRAAAAVAKACASVPACCSRRGTKRAAPSSRLPRRPTPGFGDSPPPRVPCFAPARRPGPPGQCPARATTGWSPGAAERAARPPTGWSSLARARARGRVGARTARTGRCRLASRCARSRPKPAASAPQARRAADTAARPRQAVEGRADRPAPPRAAAAAAAGGRTCACGSLRRATDGRQQRSAGPQSEQSAALRPQRGGALGRDGGRLGGRRPRGPRRARAGRASLKSRRRSRGPPQT